MSDITEFKTAELMPHEVAKLVGVGRVPVSRWMNGHHAPHPLLQTRVDSVVDAVKLARQAGLLPVPNTVRRKDRWDYIQKVVPVK